MSTPAISLLIFFLAGILVFLLFRSGNGLYWRLKRGIKQDTKIIIEDILKMLYHAEYNNEQISVNGIFDKLHSGRKHLLEILKKIEAEGLINTTDDTVKLSQAGRDYALKIIRAHRLWEKYLSEETGYDKLDWHNKAEEMEHRLTDEDTNRLAIQLGNPRFDPHGDPIPSTDGDIPKIPGKKLSVYPAGTIGRITHIEDEPDLIYKQILAEELHVGSQLKIIESNEHRIKFHSEGEECVLAPVVASNITLEKLNEEDYSDANIFRLSNLKKGESATIAGISQDYKGENRRRLLDLGIVKGTDISIDITSPLNNPKGYLIKNTVIAIRNEQAAFILIEKK
jgi:DtxR family transcriptional regulator, Mn-dependent transcriptional regulator